MSDKEKSMILYEVDRQICYEVSERFIVEPTPSRESGTIRTAIVLLRPTERIGSFAAVVSHVLNPLPIINLRVPKTTGGLGIESELLDHNGRQVGALLWNRTTGTFGRTRPSLSRAGDALQIAEPLGDAVGKAFATKRRPKIKTFRPDPCERFGPRRNVIRGIANGLVTGFGGLYAPQIAGTNDTSDKSEPRSPKQDEDRETRSLDAK